MSYCCRIIRPRRTRRAGPLRLHENHERLEQDMIMVAGHRVTTDVVAVPFSKARNLLCIYSKRHIDNPPEEKPKKMRHNAKTMTV